MYNVYNFQIGITLLPGAQPGVPAAQGEASPGRQQPGRRGPARSQHDGSSPEFSQREPDGEAFDRATRDTVSKTSEQ